MPSAARNAPAAPTLPDSLAYTFEYGDETETVSKVEIESLGWRMGLIHGL